MVVNLKMERNGLRIDVRTESDAARALVQERSDELKTALQQHGLHVERFEVTADLPPEVRTGNGSRRDALAARDADTKRRRESNRIQGMEQRPSDPRLGETPEIGRWNRRLDIRV